MSCVCLILAMTMTGGIHDRVAHGYADNAGVKIHYASLGEGPLVVMLHGFPDYWYTWRDQMEALSSDFKVVAVRDLTLVTVPGSGHFVQQDASELVTKTMRWWLSRDRE